MRGCALSHERPSFHGRLLRRLDAQEADERRIVLLDRHYVDDAQLAAVSSPDDLARLNEHRVMDLAALGAVELEKAIAVERSDLLILGRTSRAKGRTFDATFARRQNSGL